MSDQDLAISAPSTGPTTAASGTATDSAATASATLRPTLSDALTSSASSSSTPPPPEETGTRDAAVAKARFRMPTYDASAVVPGTDNKQAGMWVDAAPASAIRPSLNTEKKVVQADKRMFKGVAAPTDEESAAHTAAIKGGNLTAEEAAGLPAATAAQINPMSDVPATILKKAFHSTWSHAKHDLIGKGDGAETVMKKLWEYRQWHHESVLQAVKTDMAGVDGGKGLDKWASAGSTSLTSDIDINLKGSATEAAVAAFNAKFKNDFPYESGVVYDVNVYALDFMQLNTFGGDKSISGKEGKREGHQKGGFSDSEWGEAAQVVDAKDQEVWALTKMRLYMTDGQWADFKRTTGGSDGGDDDKFARVERRYQEYCETILEGMAADVSEPLAGAAQLAGMDQLKARAADTVKKSGPLPDDQDASGAAENKLMQAQNRAYEKKLPLIRSLRAVLNKSVAKYDALVKAGNIKAAEEVESDIEVDLVSLRRLLAEANLYANEAYVTDGGVNHTVVGMQVGAPLKTTNAESLHAITENVADILKELKRHDDTVGEAMYKGGKYFWRLGDAALNLGASKVEYVTEFYDLGFKLANEVKGTGAASPLDTAYKLTKQYLGVSANTKESVAAVMQIVRTVGARITTWYKENVAGKADFERGGAASLANKRAEPAAPSGGG